MGQSVWLISDRVVLLRASPAWDQTGVVLDCLLVTRALSGSGGSMTLNKMVCPTCNHEFYTEDAYGTCQACQTFFYAAQSVGVRPLPPKTYTATFKGWGTGR
jgi:hypothetical protein